MTSLRLSTCAALMVTLLGGCDAPLTDTSYDNRPSSPAEGGGETTTPTGVTTSPNDMFVCPTDRVIAVDGNNYCGLSPQGYDCKGWYFNPTAGVCCEPTIPTHCPGAKVAPDCPAGRQIVVGDTAYCGVSPSGYDCKGWFFNPVLSLCCDPANPNNCPPPT